jgi:hypothetical protein
MFSQRSWTKLMAKIKEGKAMKRVTVAILPLLGLAAVTSLLLVGVAFAQKIKVKTEEGHISPLIAKITYPDGENRTVMARGIGHHSSYFLTHQFKGIGKAGANVTLWLDNIATIKDTTDRAAVFVMKDGKQRELEYGNLGYSEGPSRFLYIGNEDDGGEVIDLQKLKSVDFLKPARKDKEDNVMFPNWKYSPYTGEMLPKE